MSVSEKVLKKYAELIVRTGANVRPGQVVNLTVSVEQHAFAALVIEECYKAGAKKVNVDWAYDVQSRLNFLYASEETLGTGPASGDALPAQGGWGGGGGPGALP